MQVPFFIRALGLAFIILMLVGFQAVFGEQVITVIPEEQPVQIPVVGTELFAYTVQEGDTLRSIAKMSGADVETILKLNDLEARTILRVGQKLLVPSEPQLYRLDALPVDVPGDVQGGVDGL